MYKARIKEKLRFSQCGRTWLVCRKSSPNPSWTPLCDFKCRPWAKSSSPNTNDLYIHYMDKSTGTTPSLEEKKALPNCGNKDIHVLQKKNLTSHFFLSKILIHQGWLRVSIHGVVNVFGWNIPLTNFWHALPFFFSVYLVGKVSIFIAHVTY